MKNRAAGHVEDRDIVELYDRDGRLSMVDAWNTAASRVQRERLISFEKPVKKYSKA